MRVVRLSAGWVLGDRYRLTAPLGDGGMGEVWSARHLLTGRSVAVKRLRCAPHEQAFGEARARFALEARSACEVEHPNVVEVFDFIERDGEAPFIVMELLEGETLAELLGRGTPLSVAAAADLLLPVVSAVGTAHERGIVHRDLKPSNIFIVAVRGQRPSVKVLDFGIAKWLTAPREEQGLRTRTGSTLGTPCYMAPEQATGERNVDHRVDVWSLGVILYEVLSGVRPLEGENAAQLVMRLLSTGIMPVEQLVPDLPRELCVMIGRMLSRDIGRRPEDLREVFALLRTLGSIDSLEFGAPKSGIRERAAPRGDDASGVLVGVAEASPVGPRPTWEMTLPSPDGAAAPSRVEVELGAGAPPTRTAAVARVEAESPAPRARRRWSGARSLAASSGGALVLGVVLVLRGLHEGAPDAGLEQEASRDAQLSSPEPELIRAIPPATLPGAEHASAPIVERALPAPVTERPASARVRPRRTLTGQSRARPRPTQAVTRERMLTSAEAIGASLGPGESSSARALLGFSAGNSPAAARERESAVTSAVAAPPVPNAAGVECERSSECKSRLCVAFVCQ